MTRTKVPAVSRNALASASPDIWFVTGKVQKYLLRAKAVELLGVQNAADVETA